MHSVSSYQCTDLAEWVGVNQDKLRSIRLSLLPGLTVGHLDDDQPYGKRDVTTDEDLALQEDLDAADSMIAERPRLWQCFQHS